MPTTLYLPRLYTASSLSISTSTSSSTGYLGAMQQDAVEKVAKKWTEWRFNMKRVIIPKSSNLIPHSSAYILPISISFIFHHLTPALMLVSSLGLFLSLVHLPYDLFFVIHNLLVLLGAARGSVCWWVTYDDEGNNRINGQKGSQGWATFCQLVPHQMIWL